MLEKCIVVTVIIASGLLTGCGPKAEPVSHELTPHKNSKADAGVEKADDADDAAEKGELPVIDLPTMTATIDGSAREWHENELVWKDREKSNKPATDKEFAVKRVYIGHDNEYLDLFLKCSIPLKKYWSAKPDNRRDIFELYVDTDANPATGSDALGDFRGHKSGYEVKLGVQFANYDSGPVVQFEVFDPLGNHVWGSRRLTENSAAISSLDRFEEAPPRSRDRKPGASLAAKSYPLIAYGPDGIELSVPLNVLGMHIGHRVNALIIVYRDNFYVRGSIKGWRAVSLNLAGTASSASKKPIPR